MCKGLLPCFTAFTYHRFLEFHTHPPLLSLLQVSLATVIFVASQSSLSAEVKTVIKQQLENVANGWTVYRIARQASRMVRSLNQNGVASTHEVPRISGKMIIFLSFTCRDATSSPASCTSVCGLVWPQSTSTSG